jgi:hypothetical protein
LNIINPTFKLQDEEKNIFTFRRSDYEQILPLVNEIVAPVKDIGFTINEVNLRDSRISSGELSKTVKQALVVKLQKGTSLIDLSIFIPKLVDENYVIINGRRKVPLFQLYDIPVVTRGSTIKIRTNVATLMLSKEQQDSLSIKLSFLGKKVNLALILCAYYDINTLTTKFNLNSPIDKDSDNIYENLRYDLNELINESRGYTQDDFIVELGRKYSKYNAKSKGEDILYALDLITQVDPISKRFLNTESILEEILYISQVGFVDDTLLTNKRIRCFEYIVLGKISKIIFDFCVANRTSRQPKFNTNSTQILSECNVSDIVQFDFSINPIEELTKLSRISLLGPGGFKRENIPKHLRDICPSMFGRLCPVDTPDRDNCGVLQNLISNVKVDENLRFTRDICERQPLSIPVSMTPFLKHDDQTRLQMASSQMRQSILLRNFDQPLIASGCEGLYSDKTQFVKRAKHDGTVTHTTKEYIVVMYANGTPDIFNISQRKIYVEHMDMMNIYVKVGDKFKAGDILAESTFCKDGKINIGKNLLTGVMVYYGHNYEDGIIISDRLVREDVLTSTHFEDLSFTLTPDKILSTLDNNKYKPLPDELDKIRIGEPYAIIQKLTVEDPNSPFLEKNICEAKRNFVISDVNIYANEWNTEIPEFRDWIEKKIGEQQEKEQYLQKIIKDTFDKDQAVRFIKENGLDKFSFVGKYKFKREKINGIKIDIFGIYSRPIKVGDKVANRHGNKGIISRIVPHEKMPQLKDGRHLDICINPLGIISRMNIGQLYELHLAMSFQDLKNNIIKMLDEGFEQEEIKSYLLEYIKIVDKTIGGWYLSQFQEQMPDIITKDFITNLSLIQPPFESSCLEDLKRALEYTGTSFKQKLYDPVSSIHIFNQIAVGFIYFFRMVHIAEEKLSARGIGAYARRTLQPLGGRKNKGGQRCGEMETACLIGHDAPANLFEFLTTKSDCIDLKNKYIRDFTTSNLVSDDTDNVDTVPESVKLLNSYLTVLGVDHKSQIDEGDN